MEEGDGCGDGGYCMRRIWDAGKKKVASHTRTSRFLGYVTGKAPVLFTFFDASTCGFFLVVTQHTGTES